MEATTTDAAPAPEEQVNNKPVADKKPVEEEEEIDIDLTDPDVEKAAVKIQSSFKNLMSKKKKTQPDQKWL